MAVNLYGVPRFTKDLDILIDTSETNLDRLAKAFKLLGYRPKPPVRLSEFLNPKNWARWKREKGMVALSLYHPRRPFEEIDLLVHVPLSFSEAKRRARAIRAGSLRLDLVGINDLIRLKQRAGREQDKADIIALKKVKKAQR